MKKFRHIIEFICVFILLQTIRLTPLFIVRIVSMLLGNILFLISAHRRNIALDNLRKAYRGELKDDEIRAIARKSCQSLIQTFVEGAKYLAIFKDPREIIRLTANNKEIIELFQRAKRLHEEHQGCIFVTPHLGNWELLPHVSAAVGIPLTVVARPLDNPYLEKLLYQSRVASGQLLIPKRNAMLKLQQTLQKKRSVGMLPDQSTMKGIEVEFFGRKATATPIPALLSVYYKKPIVVVACCRDEKNRGFTGYVSDALLPEHSGNERNKVLRLTQQMTLKMEEIIRLYPAQYLWIHNRWKTYK